MNPDPIKPLPSGTAGAASGSGPGKKKAKLKGYKKELTKAQ